jgi:hypothetical protein
MVFVTVKLVNVPTLVKLLETTDAFNVVPVNVPAAAVTVMGVDPSKFTPLIDCGAASFVAVPALPVTDPVMGLVTVKLVNVPTLVKLELTTLLAKVVPVNRPAGAEPVILPVTLPVNGPLNFVAVTPVVALNAATWTMPADELEPLGVARTLISPP